MKIQSELRGILEDALYEDGTILAVQQTGKTLHCFTMKNFSGACSVYTIKVLVLRIANSKSRVTAKCYPFTTMRGKERVCNIYHIGDARYIASTEKEKEELDNLLRVLLRVAVRTGEGVLEMHNILRKWSVRDTEPRLTLKP